MQIDNAVITVTDVSTAAAFYAGTLGLAVTEHGAGADVQLGVSTVTLQQGPAFEGAHHLAFGIAPEDFDDTLRFTREHLAPIVADGSEVIGGPTGWDSRSLYFRGPEGVVLEYIAREAHRGRHPATPDGPPRVTCLSEVGIAVADVPATVARLAQTFDVPAFPPQTDTFAPVGDHDGLLILVEPGRTWFPTRDVTPARGPLGVTLGVTLGGGGGPVELVLSPTTRLRRR